MEVMFNQILILQVYKSHRVTAWSLDKKHEVDIWDRYLNKCANVCERVKVVERNKDNPLSSCAVLSAVSAPEKKPK